MGVTSVRIYRFDGVEIDWSRLTVKRDGKEQPIRRKSFQVLVYLLENRSRLVTKNELIEKVWPDTAITDNTLDQALAEIRKLLRDNSRQPRFVKTVPRAGYIFVGAVEEIDTALAAEKIPAPGEPTSAESTQPRRAKSRFPLPSIIVGGVFLLIAVSLFAAWYVRHERAARQSLVSTTLAHDPTKRPVAVMFFDNESGSADVDWLREGLADMIITDLSRSNNLAILSRQQLRVLLDRAGHNPSEKISLDEALNIARQTQAKLIVFGSFAKLGDQIRIDVHLHDAPDGQLLTAERIVVDQPSQVLSQVDLLSLKLATYLAATPGDQQASLSDVMTGNLEAYRYYSLGLEKAQALQNPEAIVFFEKAIALDPEFAMADARLGYIYAVSWAVSPDKGKTYLEKAFQLSGRLTEKDKLNIAAWYAIANYDYEGAIKSFRQILFRFPLEVEAYRQLGVLLEGEERYDEAIEVLKQGLIIDFGAKDLYNSLGSVYSETGRHDESIDCYQHYVQLAPQEANAHDSLAIGYAWAGRYDEAVAEYQQALRLKPDFEIAIFHLSNTYFQQGRYREAIKEYKRYIQDAPSDNERSRGYNSIVYIDLRTGNLEAAQVGARSSQRYNRASDGPFMIAVEKRDMPTAAKLKEEFEKTHVFSRGQRLSQRPLWYYRGTFDLRFGRTAEALNEFKEALTHRPLIWNPDAYEDCLANAYLELGRLDEAIAEYERILKLNPNYPLVHYHLAQAYERKGQKDRARAEYAQFLQVWKDADADIPEVISTRKVLMNG